MAGAQDSIKIESLRTRVVRAKSKLREREAEVERLQRYRSYWDAANFKGMSEVGTLSVYLSNIKISIRTRSSPIWERSSRLHGETLRQPRRF